MSLKMWSSMYWWFKKHPIGLIDKLDFIKIKAKLNYCVSLQISDEDKWNAKSFFFNITVTSEFGKDYNSENSYIVLPNSTQYILHGRPTSYFRKMFKILHFHDLYHIFYTHIIREDGSTRGLAKSAKLIITRSWIINVVSSSPATASML